MPRKSPEESIQAAIEKAKANPYTPPDGWQPPDVKASNYYSSTWISELTTRFYFPDAQLDHAELGLDVNGYFQSVGGLRTLPYPVKAAEFAERSEDRRNDPSPVFALVRRCYWSVYDRAPLFWQSQFAHRTLLATCLVRAITFIVAQRPEPSPSSKRLIALLLAEPAIVP